MKQKQRYVRIKMPYILNLAKSKALFKSIRSKVLMSELVLISRHVAEYRKQDCQPTPEV